MNRTLQNGLDTCTNNVRIRTIDAVIITHSHADAIGGLDDLRDWTNNVQPSIPIYVAKRDFEVLSPVLSF
ncbi:putative hydrolase C777.06c-like [Trifolium medium]|uniref:Putative hydrolase C777.06c-like n=1 Tax=Trifolium medium TaxID=97028 RepID=A0A392NCX2_9FABA|nr:putative hydrolase C777.06c-like [Trifolium medium]